MCVCECGGRGCDCVCVCVSVSMCVCVCVCVCVCDVCVCVSHFYDPMIASFPGPAQYFIAISTNSDEKLGGAWERGYICIASHENWSDKFDLFSIVLVCADKLPSQHLLQGVHAPSSCGLVCMQPQRLHHHGTQEAAGQRHTQQGS